MTGRQFKRLAIAVALLIIAIIVCAATGIIYNRWCELALGIAAIITVIYPFVMSRKT